jgi:diguanylate cyclase (GGDEF)-like protein
MNNAVKMQNAPQKYTREKGRVLLVTDDTRTSALCSDLEDSGVEVVGVTGGTAALVSLHRSRPDVIIADLRLKGLSTKELAHTLTQSKEQIFLVLVGEAESSVSLRSISMELGAFDYFSLPNETMLLTQRVAQLVTLKRQLDHLRAEADRDYLTGLMNRRRFRIALGREVERWRRYRTPCSLLLIDIDFLKKINDAHGHSAGDRAIRHIAECLKSMTRDNDTSARLGGEEFALLLANTDEKNALIASIVENKLVDGVGKVTVSLGIGSCPVHALSERALYAASDAALYRAKENGRNRAVAAPKLNENI